MLSPNQKKLLLILFLSINLLLAGSLIFVHATPNSTEVESAQVELRETEYPAQKEASILPFEEAQGNPLGAFLTDLIG